MIVTAIAIASDYYPVIMIMRLITFCVFWAKFICLQKFNTHLSLVCDIRFPLQALLMMWVGFVVIAIE